MCPTGDTSRRVNLTYARLHRALRALGVSARYSSDRPPSYEYEHPETGWLVGLAAYPETDRVLGYHLAALRVVLDNFGIADRDTFASELQKAG